MMPTRIKEWKKVEPNWGKWLRTVQRIHKKKGVYAGLLAEDYFEGIILPKAYEVPTNPRIAEVTKGVKNVALGRHVARVAFPSENIFYQGYAWVVSGGYPHNWERPRMQAVMKLITDAMEGAFDGKMRPVFVSVGRIEKNPLLFGGVVFFANKVDLEKALKDVEWGSWDADQWSGVVMK